MKFPPWKLLARLLATASLARSILFWYASNAALNSNRNDAEARVAADEALAIALICPPALWFAIDFMSWCRRHYLKTFRRERGLCLSCGYDLTANASGVCPECGTPIPVKSEAIA